MRVARPFVEVEEFDSLGGRSQIPDSPFSELSGSDISPLEGEPSRLRPGWSKSTTLYVFLGLPIPYNDLAGQ